MNERKEAVSIFNMSPKIVNKATELLEAIEELALSEAGLTMKVRQLQAENKGYKKALKKIITESGKIINFPAQQQVCQAIAQLALKVTP